MKYYIKTHFIEMPNTIDLISIGIKCESGKTFYAESAFFDERKANKYVRENIIPNLRWYGKTDFENEIKFGSCLIKNIGTRAESVELYGSIMNISIAVKDFIGFDQNLEFWGTYCQYDWVAFCWLFGTMTELPITIPRFCNDLKQLEEYIGDNKFPKFSKMKDVGDALKSAIWNEEFHKYLIKIKKEN